jgi:hypothetical protein
MCSTVAVIIVVIVMIVISKVCKSSPKSTKTNRKHLAQKQIISEEISELEIQIIKQNTQRYSPSDISLGRPTDLKVMKTSTNKNKS